MLFDTFVKVRHSGQPEENALLTGPVAQVVRAHA